MSSPFIRIGKRLHGKTILLSASVPTRDRAEQYRRTTDAHFEISQAVISLARAVFSEGGQLVMGGHPSISPLVAMVAGEYREPRLAESGVESQTAQIHIFQSRAFQGHIPDETLLMYQLGYAMIHWVDKVENETYEPDARYETPPCPKSVARMRTEMIARTKPQAMVCIGGMDGVEHELDLFRRVQPSAPIYVLEKSGGASALLAARRTDVRRIDAEIIERLTHLRAEAHLPTDLEQPTVERREAVTPYPLIMQTIVDELSDESFASTS
jgi:SLOG cluster3 family